MSTRSPSRIEQLSDLPPAVAEAIGLRERLRAWEDSAGDASVPAFASVWGCIRGMLAAAIAQHRPHVLMLLPQAVDADIVAGDASALGATHVVSLPLSASDGGSESIRDADFSARMQVLQKLRERDHQSVEPLIVTSYVGAAMQRVPSPQTLAASTRTLRVGQIVEPETVRRWLAEAGFVNTTAVALPGEYASRGGILDFHSPDQIEPVRIEWFDDEIESIRRFDAATQRSTTTTDEVSIAAIGTSHGTDDARLNTQAGTPFDATIIDYLPKDTVIVLVDPEESSASASALVHRVAHPDRFVPLDDLLRDCREHLLVTASHLPDASPDDVVDLEIASADSFASNLDDTRRRVDEVASQHEVIVVGDTTADSERLSELLIDTSAGKQGRLHNTIADLSSGFRMTACGVLVLTGAELFHRSPVRRAKTRARSKPIDSFHQLKPGDLVVHLSHGVGLYRGLSTLDKEGKQIEHLTIEFDEGTKIHVPASRIALVQRYVGGTKTRPKLAKIGGQSWAAKRRAAEAAVTDMADELLTMQAARQTLAGIAFDPDNEWQRQFDASFPYLETPDQKTAIEAVKDDMERPQPMDRLICGDVGFGKTEVAMRAAFKAVCSGYQVAVLVPTTVLAEQHHHSFTTRMAEFPVEIRKLSRFCTTAEQKQTVKDLRQGQVDIVIGTHRLASQDVRFQNLGLVVIDEEQRFGVGVKERLKTQHTRVDVLTLSATPIPRTLHMALVGVRDISNLETPPAERMAVETKVTRWDKKLLRSAIVRELNRGGQMYFVHNRIGDMPDLASRIKEIVPEVRIVCGHGQMEQGALEQVMIDFIDQKYDLLLATTIIESGLDIPNANTMFIDDGGHYGLSDLHQLRGRVGRYKHQAYCYLLVSPHKRLTPEASKRLRAIEEYSQMGAGFAIAMRDLEIRGAGNLLGSQQSGHIAAVGYELYCQLLEDAVRQAQKRPPKLSAEVDIDLPIEAYLPDTYVPDMRHKIDLYRRIAAINEACQVAEIREELLDRFGELPPEAVRILELCELRLDAATWSLKSITNNERFLVLHYANRRRMEHLAKQSSIPVRIVDERRAYVPTKDYDMTHPSGEAWLQLARATLWVG
ncbi:MAG: transcription-repair coupling factor [Planctomycetota bacterium]